MAKRIRIAADGSIRLPEKLREQLGWTSASYLEFETADDRVTFWKVEVDLFAEAMKKPDADGFEKALKRQKTSREDAFKEFEERMKDPPEVRPEDRPEFWD